MEIIDCNKAFVQLGKLFRMLSNETDWTDFSCGVTEDEYAQLKGLIGKQVLYNGWFTKDAVLSSLKGLSLQLEEDSLATFTKNYPFAAKPKRIGIIMAGNIPMVGFHDFLCTLLSGHIAVCKLSSDDKQLLPAFALHLIQWCPELKDRIVFSTGKIGEIDAVIATGSNNSMLYFEQYFGKYPHIFRKNRTSVAVLTGTETDEELRALGTDIFLYFGMGCRNVSHLLLPVSYDLNRFFGQMVPFGDIVNHNKYANNYDYNKAVNLLNQVPLLDNNFLLLKETTDLHSPLAMLHYHYYDSKDACTAYLAENKEAIQVVVGQEYTPFGLAQSPKISDFADGVNTMQFLAEL